MNPERWNQVQTLFKELVDLDHELRDVRMAAIQREDPELHREIKSLLAADADNTSILEGFAYDSIDFSELLSLEGTRVGPFKITNLIGTGGMGNVYLAERVSGGFEQRVALKLIKYGTDSDRILRRFEGERSILAKLQHPNIARLLDGGITDDDQPWFAMEYVDGDPIDHYCEGLDLPIEERLELFLDVLSAVRYAHRNLVIHRDLKPSNILISNEEPPQIKLLDFGIAQIVSDVKKRSSGPASLTRAYASPEQIAGETSTLSDIFSLGIVLHELLTGCHPDPEFRSDRCRPRDIPNELLAVCQKAMQPDSEDRFETVADLSGEIQAWLNNRPVFSYSRRPFYILRKFFARNATSSAVGGLSALAIILLIFFYTTELQNEKEVAENEAARAAKLTEVLGNALRSVDPNQTPNVELTARTMLDQSLVYIEKDLVDDPDIQYKLFALMAEVYANIGMFDVADSLSAAMLDLFYQLPETEEEEHIRLLSQRSDILLQAGKFDEAGDFITEAVELADRHLAPTGLAFADVYYNYNNFLYEQGEYERADSVLRRILPIYENNKETAQKEYMDVIFFLGTNYRRMGLYDSAETYLLRSLDLNRAYHPDVHEDIASNLNHLSSLYQNMGEYEKAIPYAIASYEQRKKIFGTGHMATIASQANMARTYSGAMQLEEAVKTYEEVIDLFRQEYGEEHHNLVGLLQSYANVYLRMGRYDRAETIVRESLELSRKLLPEGDIRQAYPLQGLADILRAKEAYADALGYARQALEIREDVLAEDNPLLASSRYTAGLCLWHTGETAHARELLKNALAVFEPSPERYQDQIATIRSLGIE